jgi:Ring finger domain
VPHAVVAAKDHCRNAPQLCSFSTNAMAQDVNNDVDAPAASQSLPEATLGQDAITADPEVCVICLETVSERAVALPCKHDCFDFPCLGNWLTKHKTCPLCKREVEKLEYEFNGPGESKIFYLPLSKPDEVSLSGPTHRSHQCRCPQRHMRGSQPPRHGCTGSDIQNDLGLERRRDIYRNQLLSLHVGTNRISRYQDLNPKQFRDDEILLSRARKWIRRELRVFDFLNPDCADLGGGRRRANNAEFLLEYIVAILKAIDIKGSSGHTEELLKDFLGRDNTRIFLHELQAWLRSPYQHLHDWDRAVQYDESGLQQRDDIRSRMVSSRGTASASSSYFPSRWQWQPSQYD